MVRSGAGLAAALAVATFALAAAACTPTTAPTPTPTAATAAQATYALTLATATNGALTASPDDASHAEGATVVVTATRRAGYRLSAWGGDCATTPATSSTCTLTMDADKAASATFGKTAPAIGQAPAPEVIAVVTGKAGEVLLEWHIDPAPAGLTGWQYRYQVTPYQAEIKPNAGAWGRWTTVPGGASARSHRVTGLALRYHYFEVRAVAGSRNGKAAATVQGGPASVGADGIPEMLPGDIIEGGRAWRLHAGSTVIDVPAGTRLVAGWGALSGGVVSVSLTDVATGSVQVVDIDRAEGLGRRIVQPQAGGLAAGAAIGGSDGADRDVGAIFDQIMASARPVPLTMDADKTASATFAALPPSGPLTLIVVSDGSHDSLLLEWTGGPQNATKWQHRKRQWKKGIQGEWTPWADIPGSSATTRSYVDTVPARTTWDYQVRPVVGAVPGEASRARSGGTQREGADPLDIYHGVVVEGDGHQRWIVVSFTIVLPDGVRARASSPIQPSGGQGGTPVTVYGAGWFLFGDAGETYKRLELPPEESYGAAQAQTSGAVMDAIVDSIRPYRVGD